MTEVRISSLRPHNLDQYQKICKFCGNCLGVETLLSVCSKDVPYYGVSYDCGEFVELQTEQVISCATNTLSKKQFDRKFKGVLVETF